MSIDLLPDQQSTPTPPLASTPARRSGVFIGLIVLVLAGGLGVLIYDGIGTRVSAESTLVRETHEATALDVAITHPRLIGGAQEVILPGNTQPFIDAPIYARTSGYLRKWYADIGARVHKGDLLARSILRKWMRSCCRRRQPCDRECESSTGTDRGHALAGSDQNQCCLAG